MKKPNILFVFTDQQSANMMSCTGNRFLKTPNMDRLAAAGLRFERAYCTNPVCLPSRFSLMTGLYPGEINMYHNDGNQISLNDEIFDNAGNQNFTKLNPDMDLLSVATSCHFILHPDKDASHSCQAKAESLLNH